MSQSGLEKQIKLGFEKRTLDDRPEWDDYWMLVAHAIRTRSTDQDCQVGAVIVKDKVLISTGYNGLARGVEHHERRIRADGDGKIKIGKLKWMCHAEQNAIYNAARLGVEVSGSTIYTTKFPCLACTNAIVQSGIVAIYTCDCKTYQDDLMEDGGEHVIQVLLESGVRLKTPNIATLLVDVIGKTTSNNGKGLSASPAARTHAGRGLCDLEGKGKRARELKARGRGRGGNPGPWSGPTARP
jgi:dCMP deaminase